MWHNHAFTAAAVEHIIFLETLLDIVRFKSDNCATQYKSKYAFFLVFFGKKKCREKWLYIMVLWDTTKVVDAMTAYGAKNPIQRAVWIEKNLIQESCFL